MKVKKLTEQWLSRDTLIYKLKELGYNYNFDKYTDGQLYGMWQSKLKKQNTPPKPKEKKKVETDYRVVENDDGSFVVYIDGKLIGEFPNETALEDAGYLTESKKKKKNMSKKKKHEMGYFTKFNPDPEKSMEKFNHAMGADTNTSSAASEGGGGDVGESLQGKGGIQMTNKQIKEYFNRMDHQSLDEGTPFYNLVNMFEALDKKSLTQDERELLKKAAVSGKQEDAALAMQNIEVNHNPQVKKLLGKEDMSATVLENVDAFTELNQLCDCEEKQELTEGRHNLVAKKCVSIETNTTYYSPYDTKVKDFAKFGIRYRYEDKQSCIEAINDPGNDFGYDEHDVNRFMHDKEGEAEAEASDKLEKENESLMVEQKFTLNEDVDEDTIVESVRLHIEGDDEENDKEYRNARVARKYGEASGKAWEIYQYNEMSGDKVHIESSADTDEDEEQATAQSKGHDDVVQSILNVEPIDAKMQDALNQSVEKAILKWSGSPLRGPVKTDRKGNPILTPDGKTIPAGWDKVYSLDDLTVIEPCWLMAIVLYIMTNNADESIGIPIQTLLDASGLDSHGENAASALNDMLNVQPAIALKGWKDSSGSFTKSTAGKKAEQDPTGQDRKPMVYATDELKRYIEEDRPIYKRFNNKTRKFENPRYYPNSNPAIDDPITINVKEDIINNDKYKQEIMEPIIRVKRGLGNTAGRVAGVAAREQGARAYKENGIQDFGEWVKFPPAYFGWKGAIPEKAEESNNDGEVQESLTEEAKDRLLERRRYLNHLYRKCNGLDESAEINPNSVSPDDLIFACSRCGYSPELFRDALENQE